MNRVICRVVHLTSTGFLCGSATLNYFCSLHQLLSDEPLYKATHAVLGTAAILSGLVNFCLVKGDKTLEGGQKIWKDLLVFKFFMALLLTPLIKPVLFVILGEEDFDTDTNAESLKVKIQFWVLVVLMLTSLFTKVFREDICNNFNRDPLTSKLEELNQRFVNLNENNPLSQQR